MPTATAIIRFKRNGVEIAPGEQFECSLPEFHKWAGLGFIQRYETKQAEPPKPAAKKKPEPLSASPAAPASRRKTSKKRTKKPTA